MTNCGSACEPTPRQRVAEEFLAAALDCESYDDTAIWLRQIDYIWCRAAKTINRSALSVMAAVLERAGREQDK